MSSFSETIKNFAIAQNWQARVANQYCVGIDFANNAPTLFVGVIDDEYVEFSLPMPPSFVSITQMPDPFSKYLLSRNLSSQIGRWAIEYSEKSQEYFYVFRFVTKCSSLNQKRFNQIASAIVNEFKAFKKTISGG